MSESIQVGVPREGFYKARLVNSGLWVAVKVWYGQPIIDGEVQDRFERWCIEVNGKTCRFDEEVGHRVPLDCLERWPWVCGRPITEGEYHFLLKRKGWAEEYDPEHPAATPYEPIDLRKMKAFKP